jgi:anti-sigma B factor antagonist
MTETIAERDGTRAVIRAAGDVVAASIGELRQLMQELAANGVREMVVDLTNTRMMDSRGIGLLISAYNTMQKAGGQFAVTHASQEIFDLLRTMRIHQHFIISNDE